jgi:hypothetical protein
MSDTVSKCQACRESDCDNCLTPNPYGHRSEHGGVEPNDGRHGWYPQCCCGRITLGPTTPRGKLPEGDWEYFVAVISAMKAGVVESPDDK